MRKSRSLRVMEISRTRYGVIGKEDFGKRVLGYGSELMVEWQKSITRCTFKETNRKDWGSLSTDLRGHPRNVWDPRGLELPRWRVVQYIHFYVV